MNIRESWLDTRYDWWLDYYGTPWKARRELRRELRANLAEAVVDRGWDDAVASLGNLRQLARQNAEAVRDPRRPAWNIGGAAAAVCFAAIVVLALFASAAFTDGALAAGLAEGQSVTNHITLLPGVHSTAENSSGFMVALSISPWLLLGLPALVFLLASRVWRLARPAARSATA